MKKFLYLLLTFAVLLTACGTSVSDETSGEPTETVSVTDNTSVITIEQLPSYDVVRPEKASELLVSATSDLYKEFRNISTDITLKDDYYRADLPEYAMGDCEILIGNTNRPESTAFIESLDPGEYGYTFMDGKLLIAGTTDLYTAKAVELFVETILARTPTDGIFYSSTDDLIILDERSGESLTAMSFNVLCSKMEKPRLERVYKILTDYLPDTFGVQEATPEWMNLLEREFGDTYAYVGEGRDGGDNGEYSAIFYNKTQFTLLESGTKWLSDTPDKVSKVEESSLNRIFTYAILERTVDNTPLMIVNTHFDHTSDTARERQASVLADFLDDYTDKYPVILTGDFNTIAHTTAYEEILTGGVTDSADLAETSAPAMTFTNFGTTGKVIDFIFVTENSVMVKDYRVCNEKIDGDYPSDHHPVLIEYIPVA